MRLRTVELNEMNEVMLCQLLFVIILELLLFPAVLLFPVVLSRVNM